MAMGVFFNFVRISVSHKLFALNLFFNAINISNLQTLNALVPY